MTSVTRNTLKLASFKTNPFKTSYAKLTLLAATVFLFSACSSVTEVPEIEAANTSEVKKLWIRVSSDQDDAEERSSGQVVTSSTDLELPYDVKRGQQLVGVRFNGVKIPQGARIRHAHVRFKADEADTGSLSLKVQAHDADNAARFVQETRNLSKRPRTAAAVTWQPKPWHNVGEKGGNQWTPDLSSVLQEVVNRSGWQQGNAVAILISGESKAKRVAESYRGDPQGAPLLYIEYTAASSAPTASAPAPTPAPAPSVSLAKQALYVSLKGSDANDGRSKEKAVKTVFRAMQLVKPGDTVYLRGGMYKGKKQGYVGYDYKPFTVDGRKDARITIMSYPGERAIIDGGDRHWSDYGGISSPELFKISADYYTIQDLTFRNGAGRGLYLKGNHTVVRNVKTYNHHSDGIYGLGSYLVFEDIVSHSNYSEQNGGDSADGIKLAYGAHNTVRNFLAYNNSDDGIDIYCTTNTLVEHSVSHSNGRGHSGDGNGYKLGCRHNPNNKNTVRYNVAYKNRANNFDSNSSGGVTMLHNTSWKAGKIGFVAYAPASSGRTPNVVKNNLSYQDAQIKGMSRDDKQSYNTWNLGLKDPNFVSLDPRSSSFLKLSRDSGAVDAGSKMSLPYAGAAPDLGALEYGESVAGLLGPKVAQLHGGSLYAASN